MINMRPESELLDDGVGTVIQFNNYSGCAFTHSARSVSQAYLKSKFLIFAQVALIKQGCG